MQGRSKERKMEFTKENGSKAVCKAATMIAMSDTREEEGIIKKELLGNGIKAVAVDIGCDFKNGIDKILERAVVASKREEVISATHAEEGAVAGAAHEAITQISGKCLGLNMGGKIGIARCGCHIAVSLFVTIGLLNLNDVVVSTGHRVV